MKQGFEIFGNYLLLKGIAAGGMAEVFLARPASVNGNGRIQVIKRILPHIASNGIFLNMFQREIRIIMGFNHPHTVQLHDFGEHNNRPYIVMEFIEGKNLRDVALKFIKNKQKIPTAMTLSLIAQAAAGLSYAHSFENTVTGENLHAIHRDISPHNLILSYDGNLKVIDFGIAKAACSVQDMTQTGVLKGKAAYLSPEQILGHEVDARTDVFALGIVAWEMLTLERLFYKNGDTEVTTMSRVSQCEQHIVPPSTFNSDITTDIDEVILKALKKDPNERYATARDFQVAIRQVMLNHFPNYSYADTGALLNTLFRNEIAQERSVIRELNQKAQTQIAGEPSETTFVLGCATEALTITRDQAPVEVLLQKLEGMMKQKASTRHYVLLVFYVVSLLTLKLGDRFDLFSFLEPQKQIRLAEQSTSRTKAKSPRAPAAKSKKDMR